MKVAEKKKSIMNQREKLNGLFKGLEKKRKAAVDQFHRDKDTLVNGKRELIMDIKTKLENLSEKLQAKEYEKQRLEATKAQLLEKGGEIEATINKAKETRILELDNYSNL